MASTHSGTKPTVSNCIFWGNTGDEIYNGSGNPTFSYCDIEGSGGSESWDTDLGTDGGGNKEADPCFADVNDVNGVDDIFGTWDDGFGLDVNTSPCVDAADGDAAAPSDILGHGYVDMKGVSNGDTGEPNYVDIGAYEFTDGPAVGQVRIVVMCWIDESEWYYVNNNDIFGEDVEAYEEQRLLASFDGVVIRSGCLVPPNPDEVHKDKRDVLPSDYVYDGNTPPGGITVEEFPRSGQVLSDFTSHFDRIREGYWPDYVCLSVDNSDSMSTSTIEPYYSEQAGNNFKYWLGTNYPDAVLKLHDQETGGEQWTSELWVDETTTQIEGVLDEL